MKVKCIPNTSEKLSDKAGYPTDFQSDSLNIGKIYTVYAIGHWDDYMFYLLKTDQYNPIWFAFEWFGIVGHKIPDSWYFNFIGEHPNGEVSTIYGYKEIVLNFEHHYELMEREKMLWISFIK
ncbi:hypothetical protein [Lysinibacillus xylanilyticus]|uniref:hypothetical protein n=1 Tax=Lysinibacillus xylanilyticus TaxID=582475 RepID=UPI003D0612E8